MVLLYLYHSGVWNQPAVTASCCPTESCLLSKHDGRWQRGVRCACHMESTTYEAGFDWAQVVAARVSRASVSVLSSCCLAAAIWHTWMDAWGPVPCEHRQQLLSPFVLPLWSPDAEATSTFCPLMPPVIIRGLCEGVGCTPLHVHCAWESVLSKSNCCLLA